MKKLLVSLICLISCFSAGQDNIDVEIAIITVVKTGNQVYFKTSYHPFYFSEPCNVYEKLLNNPESFCTPEQRKAMFIGQLNSSDKF